MSIKNRRILLIDDESLVRDELGGLLEDEGYEVITAGDGEEGLALFRSDSPDMVITDVRMPQRDGLSLAMAIRAEAPAVPVTVITGHGSYKMAIEALRAGVTDFIRKPVRLEDLSAALVRMEAALRGPRPQPLALPNAASLLEQSWTYALANDIAAVPTFVDQLLSGVSERAASEPLSEVSLALRELLVNAIEHGNLGLSYHEKTEALERGTLADLLESRLARPDLQAKRVTVVATLSEGQLKVHISDEGSGFNWRSLPDPTDPQYLLAEHGRGVLLARMSVDELAYNETGNRVSISKRIN